MSEIVFLDPQQAEKPYVPALRAGASLAASINRAHVLHHYAGENDLVDLAAAIMWSVNRSHPLIDGNKRASVCLTDAFLGANKRHIAADEDALYELIVSCAAGHLSQERLAERLHQSIEAGEPQAPFAERHPQLMERLAR